jgi:hypothetical protein
MTDAAYFNRRYRKGLIAAIVGWTLAAPFLVFHEWIVPQAYQRYVERVRAVKQQPAKDAVPPSDLPDNLKPTTGVLRNSQTTKGQIVNPEDLDDTNFDGTPVSLDEWVSSDTGHPTYYTILYNLGVPISIWVAIATSGPLLLYFCLKRIAELVSLFRR